MTDIDRTKQKKTVQAPDGEPKPRAPDGDSAAGSKVSEVQDPKIAGDAGKDQKPIDAGELVVDEAGQVSRKPEDLDLLH